MKTHPTTVVGSVVGSHFEFPFVLLDEETSEVEEKHKCICAGDGIGNKREK